MIIITLDRTKIEQARGPHPNQKFQKKEKYLQKKLKNLKKNFPIKKKFPDHHIGQDGDYCLKKQNFGQMAKVEYTKD